MNRNCKKNTPLVNKVSMLTNDSKNVGNCCVKHRNNKSSKLESSNSQYFYQSTFPTKKKTATLKLLALVIIYYEIWIVHHLENFYFVNFFPNSSAIDIRPENMSGKC